METRHHANRRSCIERKICQAKCRKLSTTSTKEEWKVFESAQSSGNISLSASDYTPKRTVGLIQDDSVPVEPEMLVESSAKGKQTAVINENHPTAWQDVKATIKVETKAMVGLKGKDAQKIESELPSAHQHAVTFYIDKLLHRIENKQVPVIEKGAKLIRKMNCVARHQQLGHGQVSLWFVTVLSV